MYGAEKVSTTKCRQFLVHVNGARQEATTSSDADHQKAIEQFKREIHQVTPVRCNLFDELFQHHERQLLQEIGTNATRPRSIFANELALMKTAAKDKAYRAANKTTDNRLHFQIRISDAEREATTWSLADTEHITNQLEREICGITPNEQKRFKNELSIRMIEFEAWWETIGLQVLRETFEQRVIHFRHPEMYHVSLISESIRRMGSGYNFTTNNSEQLHIANKTVKYTQSPSVRSRNTSGQALYPPCIAAGISFERNACPWSVQKYQINLTQRCIRRFQNSQLWTAIPHAN